MIQLKQATTHSLLQLSTKQKNHLIVKFIFTMILNYMEVHALFCLFSKTCIKR